MKSYPIPAVKSSRIHNGFDTADSQFQTRQRSLSHMFDRVQVRQQALPCKISKVLLIFVFLDDASIIRSYNVILDDLIIATLRIQDWPNTRLQDLVLVLLIVQSPNNHL